MTRKTKPKTCSVNIRIPEDTLGRIDTHCANLQLSRYEFLKDSVLSYLDDMEEDFSDKCIEDFIGGRISSAEFGEKQGKAPSAYLKKQREEFGGKLRAKLLEDRK